MISVTVAGVAYNSGGKYKTKVRGKHEEAYKIWSDMMRRCYNPKMHAIQKSYSNYSVADEWHDYQNFAEWYEHQEHKGKGYALDKDILKIGNKVYSPDTCCLVPRELNSLLVDSRSARGVYPQGVSFKKKNNKFVAQISIDSVTTYLGLFDTVSEAYQTYKAEKERYVKIVATRWVGQIDTNVYLSLMNWSLCND